jgi:copper resistance protein B
MSKLTIAALSILTILLAASFAHASAAQSAEPLPATLNVATPWPSPVDDSEIYSLFLVDRLEYDTGENGSLNWDITAWSGSDMNRLWLKSEGSNAFSATRTSSTDLQVLYGRMITSFFDAQVGARVERGWGNLRGVSRVSAVLGIGGLSLYFFQLEAALFVAPAGQIAARLTTTRDLLFTQKFIAQLRLEANGSAKRSEDFKTGSGLNDLSLGIRLRYEIKKEFAPYVGVSWKRLFGDTADFSRSDGGKGSELSAVAGIRLWY